MSPSGKAAMREHVPPVAQAGDPRGLSLPPRFERRVDLGVHPALVQTKLDQLVGRASDELAPPVLQQVRAHAPGQQLHRAPLLAVRLGDLAHNALGQGRGGPLRGARQRPVGERAEDHVREDEEAEERPGHASAKGREQLAPVDGDREAEAENPDAQEPEQRDDDEVQHQHQGRPREHDRQIGDADGVGNRVVAVGVRGGALPHPALGVAAPLDRAGAGAGVGARVGGCGRAGVGVRVGVGARAGVGTRVEAGVLPGTAQQRQKLLVAALLHGGEERPQLRRLGDRAPGRDGPGHDAPVREGDGNQVARVDIFQQVMLRCAGGANIGQALGNHGGKVSLHTDLQLLLGISIGRPQRQMDRGPLRRKAARDPAPVHHFHGAGTRPVKRVHLAGEAVEQALQLGFRHDSELREPLLGDRHSRLGPHRPCERENGRRGKPECAEPPGVRDPPPRLDSASDQDRGQRPQRRQSRGDMGRRPDRRGHRNPQAGGHGQPRHGQPRTAPRTRPAAKQERRSGHEREHQGRGELKDDPLQVARPEHFERSRATDPPQRRREGDRHGRGQHPGAPAGSPPGRRQNCDRSGGGAQKQDASERHRQRSVQAASRQREQLRRPHHALHRDQGRGHDKAAHRVPDAPPRAHAPSRPHAPPRPVERMEEPRQGRQDHHHPHAPRPHLRAAHGGVRLDDRNAQQRFVRPPEIEQPGPRSPRRALDSDPLSGLVGEPRREVAQAPTRTGPEGPNPSAMRPRRHLGRRAARPQSRGRRTGACPSRHSDAPPTRRLRGTFRGGFPPTSAAARPRRGWPPPSSRKSPGRVAANPARPRAACRRQPVPPPRRPSAPLPPPARRTRCRRARPPRSFVPPSSAASRTTAGGSRRRRGTPPRLRRRAAEARRRGAGFGPPGARRAQRRATSPRGSTENRRGSRQAGRRTRSRSRAYPGIGPPRAWPSPSSGARIPGFPSSSPWNTTR